MRFALCLRFCTRAESGALLCGTGAAIDHCIQNAPHFVGGAALRPCPQYKADRKQGEDAGRHPPPPFADLAICAQSRRTARSRRAGEKGVFDHLSPSKALSPRQKSYRAPFRICSRKALTAGEKVWYFLVAMYSPTDSSGSMGRKDRSRPWVFTSPSRQRA